jgi:hypothetical protein
MMRQGRWETVGDVTHTLILFACLVVFMLIIAMMPRHPLVVFPAIIAGCITAELCHRAVS